MLYQIKVEYHDGRTDNRVFVEGTTQEDAEVHFQVACDFANPNVVKSLELVKLLTLDYTLEKHAFTTTKT